MRVAVAQVCSTDDVERNLVAAGAMIAEAAQRGATFVALPEAFAFLRREGDAIPHARALESRARAAIANWAATHNVWLLGGSIPEPVAGSTQLYNTSVLVDPSGQVVAQYRKIHLFDVDLAGGTDRYRESDTYAAGREVIVAPGPDGGVGLSICYDLRFPELYRHQVDQGARWLCVPSAFTRETGKDHWEVLLRARAIESQCYVIAPAQCGQHSPERASHGRSLIIDPWGLVLAQGGDEPALVIADCPPAAIDRARTAVPSLRNRRL